MVSEPKAEQTPIVRMAHALGRKTYPAPGCTSIGLCRGDFSIAHSLWVVRGDLDDGAILTWTRAHGDEVVYVLQGALQMGYETCGAEGAIFVPAGREAMLRAVGETRVIHFGSLDDEAEPDREGSTPETRVVSPADGDRFTSIAEDGTQFFLRFLADGTGSANRSALFTVDVDRASLAAPHSHTTDEIIHVLKGSLRVGNVAVEEGVSVGVKHGIRYSFRNEEGTTFLNFRHGDSHIVLKGGRTMHESIAARRENAQSGK